MANSKAYTVVVNGAENCSVSGAGNYIAGNEYNVTITPNTGYAMSSVYGYGNLVNSSIITVNGAQMYSGITVKGTSNTPGSTVTITVSGVSRYYKFYFANTSGRV